MTDKCQGWCCWGCTIYGHENGCTCKDSRPPAHQRIDDLEKRVAALEAHEKARPKVEPNDIPCVGDALVVMSRMSLSGKPKPPGTSNRGHLVRPETVALCRRILKGTPMGLLKERSVMIEDIR